MQTRQGAKRPSASDNILKLQNKLKTTEKKLRQVEHDLQTHLCEARRQKTLNDQRVVSQAALEVRKKQEAQEIKDAKAILKVKISDPPTGFDRQLEIIFPLLLRIYEYSSLEKSRYLALAQVTRSRASLPLLQLGDGPFTLESVEYKDEIGKGDGVVFEYISTTLQQTVEKYGQSFGERFLAPLDDIVANNHLIQQELIACGRLMQMGLLKRSILDDRSGVMAPWHPSVYYFCLYPSRDINTAEELLANNPKLVENVHNQLGRLYSSGSSIAAEQYIDALCHDRNDRLKSFNCDIFSPSQKHKIVFHLLFKSRSLGLGFLQQGFSSGNAAAHYIFQRSHKFNLYRYLDEEQLKSFTYNGEDLVRVLSFSANVNCLMRTIIISAIRRMNKVEAKELTKMWTGTHMV